VGVVRDEAFSFYYPENLEALEAAGAELVAVSALHDPELPDVDALYLGGGFPEAHAGRLAANRSFRRSVAGAIDRGLPVWAECGGLMYLAEGLVEGGERHEMVGALPLVVERTARPVGHGYVAARVDGANAFLPEGTELRGHEFHYSRATVGEVSTVLALERGTGLGKGRDGARRGRVVAAYTHLHALGVPEWAPSVVRAARGEAR
jgi:cobyrinic acid a,c-diamide synthase